MARKETSVRKVFMECLHGIDMFCPPAIGETIYCFRCDDYKRVIKAPPQYRIRCANCKLNSTYGAAIITAETRIAKHRQKCPTHKVGLYDGSLLVKTFEPLDNDMPTLLGEPPF